MSIAACMAFSGVIASPAAASPLQCVPYAREQSGISIHGNARTWWGKAEGKFQRGQEPEVGAVMAFAPTRAMPLGHVAVVRDILDERHVRIGHANWSSPGRIEENVLAEDVSEDGDWSEVRVWYGPSHALGARHNPLYGFIYNASPAENDDVATEIAASTESGRDDIG
ncbi:CHAP domain-containing protein [Altererythrobacter endophyticus]|uniref:CHAP domain-containing protein n=2 Tax=Altericroceibacterium endophyticum TaxID=1808508 RepID=A0A6I4T1S1_9SPHN|nr:CHAP domain-containing protein [Altericroceibacterium endophyticum]